MVGGGGAAGGIHELVKRWLESGGHRDRLECSRLHASHSAHSCADSGTADTAATLDNLDAGARLRVGEVATIRGGGLGGDGGVGEGMRMQAVRACRITASATLVAFSAVGMKMPRSKSFFWMRSGLGRSVSTAHLLPWYPMLAIR